MKRRIVNLYDFVYWLIIKKLSWLIMKVIFFFNEIHFTNARFYGLVKIRCYKNSFITIGKNVTFRSKSTSNLIGINRPCILSTHKEGSSIVIGNNCGFSGTVIGAFSSIAIGDNVKCGANTLLTDSDWHLDDSRSGRPDPIVIEDNVWLGVNVIVLKGVRIGKNSVIGAGSVVTKDIPRDSVAAGNPCKVLNA